MLAELFPTHCDLMDCRPPGSSVHRILQARVLEWVAVLFSRGDLPNPGIKPGSPALQADSLLSEPPEKPIRKRQEQFSRGDNRQEIFLGRATARNRRAQIRKDDLQQQQPGGNPGRGKQRSKGEDSGASRPGDPQPTTEGCWPAAAAKLLQLCPSLCDPIDGSPPGSPVPGILQTRTLERVAISFSNA